MQDYNRKLIEEFRAKRDEAGDPITDQPLLLLTTTGAKSGNRRTTPLMFVPDDDRLLVIASNAGAPKHPDWYHNLAANPEVTVEVGAEIYESFATVATGEQRERLWSGIVESYPFFADHQTKAASRQIPVIALEPLEG